MLTFLVATLRRPTFGFVNETLAQFRSHEGSITVDAMADPLRSERLSTEYTAIIRYYLVIGWAEITRLPSLLWDLARFGMRERHRALCLFGRRR